MRYGWIALSLLAAGCSDPGAMADAGATVDDSGADAGVSPSAIAPVAPPRLAPCPSGFREVEGTSFPECDPWPDLGPPACGVDEARFPGESACRQIGPACPADGLPTELPAGALYVRPGATGGDGSAAAPFGTLGEALAAGGDDTVIGLAVGVAAEVVAVRERRVTIVGACAQSVIASDATALLALRGELTLRNLRVRGGSGAISAVSSTVELESTIFEDHESYAVSLLEGSSLTARELAVRRAGGALLVSRSSATTEDVALESVTGTTANVVDGGWVARRVASGGVSGPDSLFLYAADSILELSEVALATDPFPAMLVSGGTLRLSDAVVDALPGARPAGVGAGLAGIDGASVSLERVTMQHPVGVGIAALRTGTSLELTDVVLRDVEANGDGIDVGEGAHAVLRRVWVERAGRLGLGIFEPGTEVVASDLLVRESRPDIIGHYGRGVVVQTGATLVGERVVLEANHEISLIVVSPGTSARLLDLVVRDTRVRACTGNLCAPAGIGVGAYLEGALHVERFELGGNALLGAQLAEAGTLDLVDGVVARNPVGVNLQVAPYDVGRLTERVEFRDNGVNLDSSELFVPEAAPGTPPGG